MNEESKKELQSIGEEVVADLKSGMELMMESLINKHLEKLTALVLQAAKQVIPGPFDDMVIDTAGPSVAAKVKEELLKQAERISDKV